MYLLTPEAGAFSIVVIPQSDPVAVAIRARSERHLEMLRQRCSVSLADTTVRYTPRRDYQYRIQVLRSVLAEALKELGNGLRTPNVKNSAAAAWDGEDPTTLRATWDTYKAFARISESQLSDADDPRPRSLIHIEREARDLAASTQQLIAQRRDTDPLYWETLAAFSTCVWQLGLWGPGPLPPGDHSGPNDAVEFNRLIAQFLQTDEDAR